MGLERLLFKFSRSFNRQGKPPVDQGRLYPVSYAPSQKLDPRVLSFSAPIGNALAGDIIVTNTGDKYLLAENHKHGVRGTHTHDMFLAFLLTHQVIVKRHVNTADPISGEDMRSAEPLTIGTYDMAFRISEERLDRPPEFTMMYERYRFFTAEEVQRKDQFDFEGQSFNVTRVVPYNGIYQVEVS